MASWRVLISAGTFLLWPLLPEGWRRRWRWPLPATAGVLAHASAYLCTVASIVSWFGAFVCYQIAYSEQVTALIAESDREPGAITWYGLPMFFSFFFTLSGALLTLWIGDSVARLVTAFATGEPMGSLFLWAPLRILDGVLRAAEEGRRTREYGLPTEPDRIEAGDGFLAVRANRPHEDWNAFLTFAYGGRFYRLEAMSEAPDGRTKSFVYRMSPWPDAEPIRRIVRLDER